MDTQLYNATTLISEKLEEHGLTLFEYALKQRQVVLLEYGLQVVMFVIPMLLFIGLVIHGREHIWETLNSDDISSYCWLVILVGMVTLSLLLGILYNLGPTINWILNPEFMAIKEILSLVP